MRLNLTPNEFADIVAVFLFDKFLYPDKVVPNNELFNELIDKLSGKGTKSLLMGYYLNMPTEMRLNYKRIKDVLKGGGSSHEIRIVPEDKVDKKDKKEKGGLIRKAVKIVKKLLKKEEVSKEELNLLLETVQEKED